MTSHQIIDTASELFDSRLDRKTSKSTGTRSSSWVALEPARGTHEIDRRSRNHMLQMRFR
jgi:hypothetical protein